MQFWSSVRQHLAFTRQETLAIAFLTGALLIGQAVRWYRSSGPAQVPATDYRAVDSEFVARAELPEEEVPARATLSPGCVDINTATFEQLTSLPGIGPVTAEKILRFRNESGPFERAEDLLEVKGIGPKKLARIRPYLRVD